MNMLLLVPILLPVICGIIVLFLKDETKHQNHLFIFAALLANALICVYIAVSGASELTLFTLREGLTIFFKVDDISRIFIIMFSVIWALVALAAFEYMRHEKSENRFFGFYMIVSGALIAMALAGNVFSMYLFYEMITLTSMPLVMHTLSHESIMAALKYTFYSIAGAFMVLFGIFVLYTVVPEPAFAPGGLLSGPDVAASPLVQAAVFSMIVGFGTKAGMFPMHGWLPTAHPVAPAPASAVLSGVITKAGVLGIIRVVYYVAGAEFIRGTWIQKAWLVLILITIFMGSMLAYKEPVMKKRLAYSTVSQVSYILFGLATLHPVAFVGALLHMVAHSLAKNTLFVSAGAIIYKTGITKVKDLTAIGKKMPVTMWCFTIVSLSLIGIPPTAAFVSKWYLAQGSLAEAIPVIGWLGPVILLISALLTAGYLLTITMKGFFPGEEYAHKKFESKEPTWRMTLPLIIMAALSIIIGIWPGTLTTFFAGIASAILG